MKPLLALTVGDMAGIGPEIAAPAVAQAAEQARVVVLGPRQVRPASIPLIDESLIREPDRLRREVAGPVWWDTGGPDEWRLGEVQASCGAAAVAALRVGHDLAMGRAVDALVTGPVNKAALHAGGTKVEGQTELLSTWAGAERTEMIGLAGALRVILVTRHMPLSAALRAITTARILDRISLFDEALRDLGHDQPKIAVAGLNPHAGEGGLLGEEDDAIVAPAVAAAQGRGIDALGPISPDSVFAAGARGAYTGVVALYHDQAFIPLKLVADGLGVTYIAGLPYARFSPMHGTAFDIVGQRGPGGAPLADPTNLTESLRTAARAVSVRASRALEGN